MVQLHHFLAVLLPYAGNVEFLRACVISQPV